MAITRLLRWQAAAALCLAAALEAVLGFAVVGPFLINHPPSLQNASFVYYLLYQTFPILFVLSLLWLIRRGVRLAFPFYANEVQVGIAGALLFAVLVGGVILSILLH